MALQNKNSDADFQNNEKFVQFKQQLKELKKQYGLQADREADGTEGVDEEMIVTQSQTNFMCPITLLEMKKPVKIKCVATPMKRKPLLALLSPGTSRRKRPVALKLAVATRM